MKTEFLSSLNHEIRTPLSGILGMSDPLLEAPLSPEQRDYVATTRSCAEDLLERLNAALGYAAVSAGTLTLEEADFNLVELLKALGTQYGVKAREKGLEFSAALDPALPELAFGDAVRIREIIAELLANAVKFTARGSIILAVHSEPMVGDRFRLSIEVCDTGIGIATDQLPDLFQSFNQGETGLARRCPGLGLGLALVRKPVDLLGGEIHVESNTGQGSRPSASVPLRLPAEMRVLAAVRRPTVWARRILVAEDDAVSTRILARMLGRGNYGYCSMSSGEACLSEAGARRYHAILMDLELPGIDGFKPPAFSARSPATPLSPSSPLPPTPARSSEPNA